MTSRRTTRRVRTPLLFLENETALAAFALERFRQLTRTRANLLMSSAGQIYAQAGNAEIAQETIAALVGASYQALRDVTKIVPPDELVSLTHEGQGASIQVTQAAEGTIVVTIFDPKTTTVGEIIFYLREVIDQINPMVRSVAKRKAAVKFGDDFHDSAENALDDIFGESEPTEPQPKKKP
jgi:hypothetical protein